MVGYTFSYRRIGINAQLSVWIVFYDFHVGLETFVSADSHANVFLSHNAYTKKRGASSVTRSTQ